MSHPLIHAGLSLFVFATTENGGALSLAVFAASVAWQLDGGKGNRRASEADYGADTIAILISAYSD